MPTQILRCPQCASDHLYSNGHAKNGKRRFQCQDCHKYSCQDPGSNAYDEKTKAMILAAYHERPSLRGLQRVFGICRQTLVTWLKKAARLPKLRKTLIKAEKGEEPVLGRAALGPEN